MKITAVRYQGLQNFNQAKLKTQTKFKKNNSEQNVTNPLQISAYQDFNVSFSGRTPENFYAQDFNRENMPTTMKRFLDYDYAQRQHIPPEQMMHEVFKYLDRAKDFDEVKKLYPDEELFKDLHPNRKNTRKDVLSEIKIARELSSTPLLKDGSDNFGMYLLRKIYSEGKTLKEISKDFLEKDMSDEYKGFITKPVDYSTTSAYGIKFPNNAFWHSFISTREEYKKFFVTLPKNMVDPNRIHSGSHSKSNSAGDISSKSETNEVQHLPRKHKLQDYKKKQITNDIKDSNGDIQTMEKKIRKRFSKDDPEASFIVKYWSPIMTVATDKIHLSEELKAFNEDEKLYGRTSDDSHMLKRFWRANPLLLEDFSKAVPDTIEMFEDVYGGGGVLPINSDLEVITDKSENQKIIDFVSPEFIELLDYSKNIDPKRAERYRQHDELQKQWEEHFLTRYGETKPETAEEETSLPPENVEIPYEEMTEEILNETAKKNNSQVFKLKGVNGDDIYAVGNPEEFIHNLFASESSVFPNKFANAYIRELEKSSDINDNVKLSISVRDIKEKVADERIMTDEELENALLQAKYHFYYDNINKSLSASLAMSNIINKYLPIEPHTLPKLNCLMPDEFRHLGEEKTQDVLVRILENNKNELNNLYESYTKPLTNSEKIKVNLSMIDGILHRDGGTRKDTTILINAIREAITTSKYKRKFLKDVIIPNWLNENSFSKTLLDKDISTEEKQAKFELIMNFFTRDLVYGGLLPLVGKDIMDKYYNDLSPALQKKISEIENVLGPSEMMLYKDFNFGKLEHK